MKKCVLFGFLVLVLIGTILFPSCNKSTTTTSSQPTTTIANNAITTTKTTQSTTVTTTATAPILTSAISTTTKANWWDAMGTPQYGGTINLRLTSLNANFDTWYAGPFSGQINQYEGPFWDDWTLDRNTWSFKVGFTPPEYKIGGLAASWDMPDVQTLNLHVRQGILWQNIAPVNGRELTADDFVYQYNRMFGLGGGFTTASPYWTRYANYIATVSATDKYTVNIKFKKPAALNLLYMQEAGSACLFITPRETVEQSKDAIITDWKIAAGTGPWMVTDFITSTSVTYGKSPNYWGYDERYPKNRLPYADTLKVLNIPDAATAMASLRTGKIDLMTDLNWQQADSLVKTNPDLQQTKLPAAGYSVDLRIDKAPFTDINVRKALQMALDRESIAKNYYGGTVDGKPAGLVSTEYKGWCTPYDEWSQELHDEYSYNIIKARALLTGAGYPNGFKTNIVAAANMDLNLLQLIKAQFLDVGVDMEIRTMDPGAFSPFAIAGKQDQMTYYQHTAPPFQPWVALDYRSKIPVNFTFNKDAIYNAMVTDLETNADSSKPKQISNEADMYALSKHWAVQVCPTALFTMWQSTLKGYSGESGANYAHYARWWVANK